METINDETMIARFNTASDCALCVIPMFLNTGSDLETRVILVSRLGVCAEDWFVLSRMVAKQANRFRIINVCEIANRHSMNILSICEIEGYTDKVISEFQDAVSLVSKSLPVWLKGKAIN